MYFLVSFDYFEKQNCIFTKYLEKGCFEYSPYQTTKEDLIECRWGMLASFKIKFDSPTQELDSIWCFNFETKEYERVEFDKVLENRALKLFAENNDLDAQGVLNEVGKLYHPGYTNGMWVSA